MSQSCPIASDPIPDKPLASSVLHPSQTALGLIGMNKQVITSTDKAAFRLLLDGAAANPTFCTISNRFPWQARLAAEKLLAVAKQKRLPVRILSGKCHEGFYDSNCAALLRDCKLGGTPFIRVLVWQNTTDGISPALVKLADEGLIEIRVSGTDKLESKVPHFLLVGENAFRQEAGHLPFTPQTVFTDLEPQVPARIDFDDPRTGKVLSDLFDNLWGNR